ncbi:Crp/Fnr family transcriptional regulator [Planococcus sp. MERTA32b]|nr:Crp/Fnr family transcriptional regulator [Planococcus sp. MER TA 32b]
MPLQEPDKLSESKEIEKHKSCVSIVPIFNHLEDDEMNSIVKSAIHLNLKKNEILYRAGDHSNSLYIVHKGKVRVYRLSENGREQLIRILNPGEFTGELALFRESVHEVYAEAMEQTEICSIQRGDLQQILQQHPTISLKILNEFSKRLDNTEHLMTSFATENVETRIALYLVQQAEDSELDNIILPMSRKDLASYLGTTPETISRKLAKFEDEGLIYQKDHRSIEILDIKSLQSV